MIRIIILSDMSQVSKKPLSGDIERKIYSSLIEAIKLLKSDQEVDRFLYDLMTPTERVMIPKRLAIAVLWDKGWSQELICTTLNVSPSTVAWVSKMYQLSSGFKKVIEKLKHSEGTRAFWQDLENLLYRMSAPGKVFLDEGVVGHKLGHSKKTLV